MTAAGAGDGPGGDVARQVREAHRGLVMLVDALAAQGPRAELVRRLREELEAHRRLEEGVLYPVMAARSAVAAGQAQRGRREHRELAGLADGLREEEPAEEFAELLVRLDGQLAEHIRENEERILPQLGDEARLALAVAASRNAAPRPPRGRGTTRVLTRLAVGALTLCRLAGRGPHRLRDSPGPAPSEPGGGRLTAATVVVPVEPEETHPSREPAMPGTAGPERRSERPPGGVDHRTAKGRPLSWIAVAVVIAGFVTGGLALVLGPVWWLVAAGAAVVVAGGLIAAKARIMEDYRT